MLKKEVQKNILQTSLFYFIKVTKIEAQKQNLWLSTYFPYILIFGYIFDILSLYFIHMSCSLSTMRAIQGEQTRETCHP